MYSINFYLVEKTLAKLPHHIVKKVMIWAKTIELFGMEEMRSNKGYRDKRLIGKRKGQRVVRLSKSYRLFYKIKMSEDKAYVIVLEISNHEY